MYELINSAMWNKSQNFQKKVIGCEPITLKSLRIFIFEESFPSSNFHNL